MLSSWKEWGQRPVWGLGEILLTAPASLMLWECSKLIHQAGIKRVVFLDKYKDTTGIQFLKEAGVITVHLPSEEAE